MNRLTLTLAVFLLIAAFGCSKSDNVPLDYMTCKINGKNWEAKSHGWSGNRFRTAHIDGGALLLHGSNHDEQTTIDLFVYDTSKELSSGSYTLGLDSQYVGSLRDYKLNDRWSYITDPLHKGVIQFTLNRDRTRVDGTFSFTAKFEQSAETVEVTGGKFSIAITN